jgi:hypothetical protein
VSEVTEVKNKTIELKIVYSHNKKLEVSETETIDQVKLAALDLFKIAREEAGSFVLKAKVEGEKDTQLDEAKTVADYGLKDEQKVILTAGSPFGAGRG